VKSCEEVKGTRLAISQKKTWPIESLAPCWNVNRMGRSKAEQVMD
jgi:hypothetical protein